VLTEDHLNLRLVRIKSAEQWAKGREGVYFLFPRGGTGQFVNGPAKQPLSIGDVLVINGEPRARVNSVKGAEFAFWGFSLRMDHLLPLFGCAEISLLQSVLERFKGYKYYPASSTLAAECHSLIAGIPSQFNLDHRGHLLRLAAVILNEEFKTAQGQRVGFISAEDHLVQVFEKLSADDMLTLSVDDLASRFGCSRRHLNRLFHQYFGYSVAALRMEMRLLKAVSLLRDCDAKVINVAEQCGFNHLGLFNTCFRRRFGTSPGQWRKQNIQAPQKPARSNGDIDADCPIRMKGLCPWPVNSAAGAPICDNSKSSPRPMTIQRQSNPKHKPAKLPLPAGLKIAVTAAQKVSQSLAFEVRAQT
jgi:AraC-like DNA-binding protein